MVAPSSRNEARSRRSARARSSCASADVKAKNRQARLQSAAGRRQEHFASAGCERKELTLFTRFSSPRCGTAACPSSAALQSRLEAPAIQAAVLKKRAHLRHRTDVEGGMTFSEALAKLPQGVRQALHNMVRAGEVAASSMKFSSASPTPREVPPPQEADRRRHDLPPSASSASPAASSGHHDLHRPEVQNIFSELDVTLPA